MKSLKIVTMGFFLFFALVLGFQSYAMAADIPIKVDPISGLTTTEAGGKATFTVVLLRQPAAGQTVDITLTTFDASEGDVTSILPAPLVAKTLHFVSASYPTTYAWNTPQTVTVTGADDSEEDGNVSYWIITDPAVSGDPVFSGVNPDNVSIINTDNDHAGITVTPTSGLVTSENLTTAIFSVVLKTKPSADVRIELSSSDLTEGDITTPAVKFLNFTSGTWNAPQYVTVTGKDDVPTINDGNIAYTIITAPAQSADAKYNNDNADDVSIINNDNFAPGVTVNPVSGLTTTEAAGAGHTTQFKVVLNTPLAAGATVTITLSSSNLAEGDITVPLTHTLTFDNLAPPVNPWNIPQTVTVTGQNDVIPTADDNIAYTIMTSATSCPLDSTYDHLNVPDVSVVNIDDDVPKITVFPTSGLVTAEAGGAPSTFTVVLDTKPAANVTIGLSSSMLTEGTVSPASLTFAPGNWNVAQTVYVSGVDDSIIDGQKHYTIITAAAVSTDPMYSGRSVADVAVDNVDNDSANVIVTPTTGLTTTESGGTATFTVVLGTQPTASVTIGLSSSKPTEGTVSSLSLIFTSANWDAPQMVTVTGVDDNLADGRIPYTIITAPAVSTDTTGYNGFNPAEVAIENSDNDMQGITVTPTTGLTTTEAAGAGHTASFTVVLNKQPTAEVRIDLNSNKALEGDISTPSTKSLIFTSANWNIPQTVIVTGTDDDIADPVGNYQIHLAAAVSSDPTYSGVIDSVKNDVSLQNIDNEKVGITVTPTIGLTTTEEAIPPAGAGHTANFSVVLTSQPDNVAHNATITIGLFSPAAATEGDITTPVTKQLIFTAANWNIPQTVTVTGINDWFDDGDKPYTIQTTLALCTDTTGYAVINPDDVSITNTDDTDTTGITINPTSGLATTEAGGYATFTVVLDSMPTAAVSIGLTSSNTFEGIISTPILNFTAANWNITQTVTITGQDDLVTDGNVDYLVITAPAVSADTTGYSGFNPADVSVNNMDNEAYGITVTPTKGVRTTEAAGAGHTNTFSIVLNKVTTASVTIGLSGIDTTEGTVTPTSLTFNPGNWSTPQVVTITGVDEKYADGDITYTIITAPAQSSDANYSGRDAADVTVTNIDDEKAGVNIVTGGLTTTEASGPGHTTTFTVALKSEPTTPVIIPLSSSKRTEGLVSPTSLTFTSANWNTPQTVLVTGQDDISVDGNVAYTIITELAQSTDAVYSGFDADNIALTNIDNDSVGITVAPILGLTTREDEGTATFTVVLDTQPKAPVTIGLSSSKLAEGTVLPTSLIFTATDWSTPKPVTVTGVPDSSVDGNQIYMIIIAAAVSTDTDYNGKDPFDVSVTNIDITTANVIVTPTSGLTTTEATGPGHTTTFTAVLSCQPAPGATVTIGLSSSDTGEGTVSPASLIFTTANWNAAQTVTVTGVNDDLDDGDVAYTIITAPVESTDSYYIGIDPANVSVTNIDNQVPNVTITPTSGLITSENGRQATFTVVLNSTPTADVTINLTSSTPTEGTVSPVSLTFTPIAWNTPQTVKVTGVDDNSIDGDVPYTIIPAAPVSADTSYNGLTTLPNISITNIDNDVAKITVSPTGLATTEAGGKATFMVVLTSQPTADVAVALSSSNIAEGTVLPASLSFTSGNWNAAQTVTVTGVNDDLDDNNVAYSIITTAAVSMDQDYGGKDPVDVSVTNADDENPGITVTPITGLTTTEAKGTAIFTVILLTKPTANVTINLTSSDTTEGTVLPAILSFTPDNWDIAQTVTVTGVNDYLHDGNIAYTITTAAAMSADTSYDGIDPADVSVTNTDNDIPGITVNPTSGLTTNENAATATFTVVLNSQPTADVTMNLSSTDTTEGTIAPASLTFTATNFNTPQTVTITGVDDSIADGPVAFTITLALAQSTDTDYDKIDPTDVSVANEDNEPQSGSGLTVNPTSGLTTTEAAGAGHTATFTVVLNSAPTANVTIALSSFDITEGTVSPAGLTFTSANWNSPQTVTVTGVDDLDDDSNVDYKIITAPAVSTDANFNGSDPADVLVNNIDDETAGVTVKTGIVGGPTTMTTTEAGVAATFTVVLNSQPTAEVTINLSSSDATEGTVSPGVLTFTSTNWNTAQTVTVTGVDDTIIDHDIAYTINTALVSTDTAYAAINPIDVSATNIDDDIPAITVIPTSGLVTTENGGKTTFTVVLTTLPTADVTIAVSSSDLTEGTVSPASLIFTSANGNTPQTVTITGVADNAPDGNIGYTIVTAPAVSADAGYHGQDPANVSVTNTDNWTPAGITVTPATGLTTTEAAGADHTKTFTVVLNSQPTDSVTVGLTSSDTTEGTVSPANVTFTTANWNIPQPVTVTGIEDKVVDANASYMVVVMVTSTTDPNYGTSVKTVPVTNTDSGSTGGESESGSGGNCFINTLMRRFK